MYITYTYIILYTFICYFMICFSRQPSALEFVSNWNLCQKRESQIKHQTRLTTGSMW